MAIHLYFCNSNGVAWREQVFAESTMVATAIGSKRADLLVASTKASITIPGLGGDINGSVSYTARHGGLCGNGIRVCHSAGQIGGAHANRPLSVSAVGRDVTVVFGTDGGGFSVKPTAQAIVDLLTANSAVRKIMAASINGTGAGTTELAVMTSLSGGLDTGDFLKLNTKPPAVLRISTVEVE